MDFERNESISCIKRCPKNYTKCQDEIDASKTEISNILSQAGWVDEAGEYDAGIKIEIEITSLISFNKYANNLGWWQGQEVKTPTDALYRLLSSENFTVIWKEKNSLHIKWFKYVHSYALKTF